MEFYNIHPKLVQMCLLKFCFYHLWGLFNGNIDVCEDNGKMCLLQVGYSCVDWFHLAQGRNQWGRLVNMLMNLSVSWKAGYFESSWVNVCFSRKILCRRVKGFILIGQCTLWFVIYTVLWHSDWRVLQEVSFLSFLCSFTECTKWMHIGKVVSICLHTRFISETIEKILKKFGIGSVPVYLVIRQIEFWFILVKYIPLLHMKLEWSFSF